MKYQPPFEPGFAGPIEGIHNSDPDAVYINGNPATGQEGSIPPMEALYHPMRELTNLIEFAELDPSHTDLEQVRKAINWMIDYLVTFGKAGDGVDLYKENDEGVYILRSLVAGDNITLSLNPAGGIVIAAASGGGGGPAGEANTASNVGDTGIGVFKQKNALDFEFRKIEGINGATVTLVDNVLKIAAPGVPQSLATVAPAYMLEERRASGAATRVLSIGAWTRRAINTTIINQIAGASLASEQITLPAGTYRATFLAVAARAPHHRARLFNVTAGVAVGHGNSSDSHTSSDHPVTPSLGIARFVLAVTSVLEVQTYVAGNKTGLSGDAEDQNIAPDSHVDGWIEIVKEA